MIKVVIVDDVLILRQGLKILLEQDSAIKVIADCSNGLEALESCKQLMPDIVLMDVRMPGCDGIEGTKLIKEFNPAIKVIILTLWDDSEKVIEAINYGADGFLLKDINEANLTNVIKSTMNGLNIVQNCIFNNFKKQYPSFANLPGERHVYKLTTREKSIVRMIVDGKGNKEIAAELHLAEGSVRNAISAILDKVELKDRTQLAIFAIKNGIA